MARSNYAYNYPLHFAGAVSQCEIGNGILDGTYVVQKGGRMVYGVSTHLRKLHCNLYAGKGLATLGPALRTDANFRMQYLA